VDSYFRPYNIRGRNLACPSECNTARFKLFLPQAPILLPADSQDNTMPNSTFAATTLASPITPLQALDHWAPIVWLKTNVYAYPTLEVMHIVAIALVFGTIWIVDLRLLVRLRALDQLDVQALAKALLPWTLVGFMLAAATGLTMFVSRIGDLINNTAFIIKICLLFAAGTNAAILHARGRLDAENLLTRMQAALSIAIWLMVITGGRWIAYL